MGAEPMIPEAVRPDWERCTAQLTALGLATDVADAAVARAFGWGRGRAYWLGSKTEERPDPEAVRRCLDWLKQLGIASPADQGKLVTDFPQVLGLPLDLMQRNADKLTGTYRMQGPTLAAAIRRRPRVLGAIVDCEGDCQGNCSRCFAQF